MALIIIAFSLSSGSVKPLRAHCRTPLGHGAAISEFTAESKHFRQNGNNDIDSVLFTL
jgi:hypothetical protein